MYTRSKKFSEGSRNAKCDFCKSNKVHWAQTEYGWLLFNKNGKRHLCKQYKLDIVLVLILDSPCILPFPTLILIYCTFIPRIIFNYICIIHIFYTNKYFFLFTE